MLNHVNLPAFAVNAVVDYIQDNPGEFNFISDKPPLNVCRLLMLRMTAEEFFTYFCKSQGVPGNLVSILVQVLDTARLHDDGVLSKVDATGTLRPLSQEP